MPNKVKNNKQTKIKAPIVEALKTAYNHPTYQFHIPGHTKGFGTLPEFRRLVGKKALMVDTTDEFDNLGTLTPATGPIKEAEEHDGPSIILAYSPFIEQGIKGGMGNSINEEKLAVMCGYVTLMRYFDGVLHIDSAEPNFEQYDDFLRNEVRYNA